MSDSEKLAGVIVEVLEQKLFRVRVGEGKSELIAGVDEIFRRTNVRLREGETVFVIRSAVDPTRGRIVGRARK